MRKKLLVSVLVVCMTIPMLFTNAFALPKNVTIINIPEANRGEVGYPSEGLMSFATGDNQFFVGYMDYKGKVVIPRQFQEAEEFHDGLAVVRKDDKWGAINKSGAVVVPIEYEKVDPRFWNGLLAVKKDGKWGMVDSKGAIVIPLMYDSIDDSLATGEARTFVNGKMFVKLNGLWGAINRQNNIVIPFLYTDRASTYNDIQFLSKMVEENGKMVKRWGAINDTGGTVVPFVYDKLDYYAAEDAMGVCKGGKWGFFDLNTGKEFVPLVYDKVQMFDNGFALIEKDKKLGYVNRAGVVIAEPQYDEAKKGFRDGIALVAKREPNQREGGWGYINTSGTPITEFKFFKALPFSEGLGTAGPGTNAYDTVIGAINTKGETVIPFQYGYIGEFKFGRAFFMPMTKPGEGYGDVGFMDKNGKVTIAIQYKDTMGYTDFGGGDGDAYAMGTYTRPEFEMRVKAEYHTKNMAGAIVKPYGFALLDKFENGVAKGHSSRFYDKWSHVAWIINNDYQAPTFPYVERSVTFPCNKSSILINGTPMNFEGYTLVGNNYFKLRDLAMALNGTTAQFNVTWDAAKGAVNIIPGEAYRPAGGELAAGDGAAKNVAPSAAKTYIRGQDSGLVPVAIQGNNYYMLRGLMEKLGVTVGWDGATNTISLTTKTAEQGAADGQAVTGALADGVYTIRSAKNDAVGFAVSAAKTEPGTKIILYTVSGEDHYKYQVTDLGGGKYTMSPLSSGLMVTSPQKKGSGITQQQGDGSAAQSFTITYQNDGTYRIQDCGGLYLAASGGKAEDRSEIILWTQTEEAGQKFVFERSGG